MSVGYFFLRPKKPAAKEPNPSKPSNGSGEAVWGSFWPASAFAFWSAAGAWSAAVEFLSLSEEVALWSAAALLAGAAFWSVPVVLLAGGFWAVVELAAAFWSAVELLGEVVLLVEGVWFAAVLEAVELWSVVLVVLLGDAVLEAAAFWSAGAAVVAGAVLLEAFWSVPVAGGFTGALLVDDAALALLVSLLPAAAGVLLLADVEGEAALWSVELVEAGDEALDVVEAGAAALEADWSAADVPAAAPDPEAWLLVQESEIILTELTCNEPSLARVPCTWTWCPSCGFSMELSPCRLMVWPLSDASTQFPPDCFRQPRMELDWSLVLVVLEFVWSAVEGDEVEGEVDGLVDCWVGGCWGGVCWSGVEAEPPVCANAMPVVSISAKINFLFMSLLLRYLRPFGLDASISRQRPLR
jgi:hypothetical protein